MKIASIQLNSVWQDKVKNFERAKTFIEQAKSDNCDLVIFPEMFNTGFSMNAQATSEANNSQTQDFLKALAKQYQINIIAGFVERRDGKDENVSVLVDRKGKLVARYVKNYPFTLVDEQLIYATGRESVVFQFENISASLFICYDLRFPELFREVAKQVEIIFVIANWPKIRQDHWQTLLKARAIENQCFVVGVNRIGVDGNQFEYTGGSRVYDPLGVCLSAGSENQEYLVTKIDLAKVKQIRQQLPFLEDIKI